MAPRLVARHLRGGAQYARRDEPRPAGRATRAGRSREPLRSLRQADACGRLDVRGRQPGSHQGAQRDPGARHHPARRGIGVIAFLLLAVSLPSSNGPFAAPYRQRDPQADGAPRSCSAWPTRTATAAIANCRVTRDGTPAARRPASSGTERGSRRAAHRRRRASCPRRTTGSPPTTAGPHHRRLHLIGPTDQPAACPTPGPPSAVGPGTEPAVDRRPGMRCSTRRRRAARTR